ncbi:MAG TPA: hypothetical protein VER11_34470 [Polyangiaceae bacterium]|nr:hypothetical protein [Polyangiaceae bacterium]
MTSKPSGSGGGSGGDPLQMTPVATVIVAEVASLASGPTSNDGVSLNGKIVALANQSNTAHNKLYLVTGTVYTEVATQPPENGLITVTEGINLLNSTWKYTTGAISIAQGGSSGLIQGVYTLTDFAPDALGIPLITNPGIPKQAFTNDGSYHTIWSFDFPARGYTSGRLVVNALIWLVDGSKESEARMRVVMTCSATPTAGAPAASSPVDIIDDGSGPYFDARWFVVGTALCLQIKMLQAGTTNCVGIVGAAVGR